MFWGKWNMKKNIVVTNHNKLSCRVWFMGLKYAVVMNQGENVQDYFVQTHRCCDDTTAITGKTSNRTTLEPKWILKLGLFLLLYQCLSFFVILATCRQTHAYSRWAQAKLTESSWNATAKKVCSMSNATLAMHSQVSSRLTGSCQLDTAL